MGFDADYNVLSCQRQWFRFSRQGNCIKCAGLYTARNFTTEYSEGTEFEFVTKPLLTEFESKSAIRMKKICSYLSFVAGIRLVLYHKWLFSVPLLNEPGILPVRVCFGICKACPIISGFTPACGFCELETSAIRVSMTAKPPYRKERHSPSLMLRGRGRGWGRISAVAPQYRTSLVGATLRVARLWTGGR